jgi:uroporphyrinogen-III decarboxylase
MGGISEQTTLKSGTPEQVRDEVKRALDQSNGQHFLLAPGCAVPPDVPARNLEAIRSALA